MNSSAADAGLVPPREWLLVMSELVELALLLIAVDALRSRSAMSR